MLKINFVKIIWVEKNLGSSITRNWTQIKYYLIEVENVIYNII